MENKEIISVLIPTYNRKDFLCKAVVSALNQSYPDIKVLIYDDGSTDDSQKAIGDLLKDPRVIYYYCAVNRGVSVARNALLDLCPSSIAAWMDSDDLSHRNRLETQYEILKKSKSLVYSAYEEFRTETEEDTIRKTTSLSIHIPGRMGNATGMFYIDKKILFNEKLRVGEDNDWRNRMNKKYKEIRIPEVLYYVRIHPNSLTANRGKKNV